ncbi:GGDEF domain-containing protein [Agarivorans gilvus]|uniref:Diguanylate cyclase DosC n=1 Tax=Agarivorans gilvus TaxID=680279 RepID=A0ABQ1HY08_9ALTE|nr:GGDEF domain-containing protein [Agarivorans gilvus]GGA95118.1 sensor histidine kinase [Agarivorans gilvus]
MKLTDTSLLEQMHISDVEIQNRMRLLGLDESALDLIAKQRGLIEEEVDGIVNRFYDIQTEVDEIASLIGDTETLSRLRIAQRRYITDLFLGVCDSDYVNNRLRIGMVHKRIGVEPKLYLSAVSTLKDLLFELLSVHLKDKQQLAATLSALDKLFYFDTTLIFDTYIASLVGEIELAKRKTEDYAKSLEQKVAERTRQLEKQTRLDGLTGIYNLRAVHDILHRELAVAQRRESKLCLVYIDLDNFKQINDSEGHLKGDEVLKCVAKILLASIREVDAACRYGGDEFCLILPDCDAHNAYLVCQKVIENFLQHYQHFSLSMGVVQTGPTRYYSDEQIIKLADQRMYQAKEQAGCSIFHAED